MTMITDTHTRTHKDVSFSLLESIFRLRFPGIAMDGNLQRAVSACENDLLCKKHGNNAKNISIHHFV